MIAWDRRNTASVAEVAAAPRARILDIAPASGVVDSGGDPARPGTLIDGTYRVVRCLGAGAMGLVVLARDERLDRNVAIKLLRPELVVDEELRGQFAVEARAMACVRHRNVVLIHAFGEHEGAPYFVMDYVPGTTLERWLDQRGRELAVDEALGLLEQACAGVEAIHAAGAVHGDIKSANVIVDPAFQVRVADFGLARVLGRGHHALSWVGGTPEYMAPELLGGAPIPPELLSRRDVYALGVLAFELLTGRYPFPPMKPGDVVRAPSVPPPAPSDVRPDLPAELDGVVLAALAKDPAARTPSAAAFAAALRDARQEASTRGPRIVIADDDADVRESIAALLINEFPRADIVSVGDGAAALEAIDACCATLAILDIGMPRMNGIEVVAALRGNARTEKTPILVATAIGATAELRALSGLGVQAFLFKPIDPRALLAQVRVAIG